MIAVLCERYPELSETFVVTEVAAMRRQGRSVLVVARRRAAQPNPEAPDDVPIMFMEDEEPDRIAVAWDLRARLRWRREEAVTPLRALAPVGRRLRDAGVEHLHAHFAAPIALDALRLSRVLGVPWSLTAHAYDIYQRPRNLPEKLRSAAFVTSGCDYTVRDLRAIGGNVHRVVMGVDGERFRRTRPYPGGRTVLGVGRLVEKKGFAHLVAAARELDADVVIAGDGPLRAELEAAAGGRVRFVGAVAPARVRELLDEADVLAMPCVIAADGDRDSLPVVVKEAMAMEVPVVAADEVGLPEIVREPWGRLVPPGDATALAEALRDVLALPAATRAAMGRAGREIVLEHASVDRETARLLELIDATRRGGSAPTPGPDRPASPPAQAAPAPPRRGG